MKVLNIRKNYFVNKDKDNKEVEYYSMCLIDCDYVPENVYGVRVIDMVVYKHALVKYMKDHNCEIENIIGREVTPYIDFKKKRIVALYDKGSINE